MKDECMGKERKSMLELTVEGEILLILMTLDKDSQMDISNKFPCITKSISDLIEIS